MGIEAKDFGITLAINFAIGVVCFLVFGVLRSFRWCNKFFAPKEYLSDEQLKEKPKPLPATLWGWIGPLFSADQNEVIRTAGVDAAMYAVFRSFLELCLPRDGLELFLFVSLIVLAACLPVNLTSNNVNNLMAEQLHPQPNPFAYWIPPPPPPNATSKKPPAPSKAITAPEFYEVGDTLPPAPPGLKWYEYKEGVPPLPTVASKLGPKFARYIWMYDPAAQISTYTFTKFDQLTLSNVEPGDNKLWVFGAVTWIISLYFFWLLLKYSREAVALRLRYLASLKAGVQTRTVLTTDIPGLPAGTMGDRLGASIGFLPEGLRQRIKSGVAETAALGSKAVEATAGSVAKSFVGADGAGGKLGPIEADAWAKAEAALAKGLSSHQLVEGEFEELYPGQVDNVTNVYNTATLDGTYAKYNAIRDNLTDLLDDYTSKSRRGKTLVRKQTSVIPLRYGQWATAKYGNSVKPVKVDAMEFMLAQLEDARGTILKQQEEARAKSDPAAFVTFRSRRAQMIATTVLQHHDTTVWNNEAAPAPEEVYWPNLR